MITEHNIYYDTMKVNIKPKNDDILFSSTSTLLLSLFFEHYKYKYFCTTQWLTLTPCTFYTYLKIKTIKTFLHILSRTNL